MTLLHLIRARLRAAKIRRLEQDIDWARASSDAHLRELEQQRAKLAGADPRTSADIARDVALRARGAL